MYRVLLLTVFAGALFTVSPLLADEAKTDEAQAVQEQEVDKQDQIDEAQAEVEVKTPSLKEPSPKLKKLNNDLRKMTVDMETNNRRHFFMIYNNHNMISTVKHVRDQVSNAIDACSENNPDMKDDLKARFETWTQAVNEGLKDAEAHRDNMIVAQDYAKASKIRSITRQSDAIRDETNDELESIPVTTPEACEYLLNKMDETQASMTAILRAALVTLPQAIQSLPDEDSQGDAPAETPEE